MAGGLFAHLFVYAAALIMLPSTIAGAVIGMVAKTTNSNLFSQFHHCLFAGVVWSVVLIFVFGTTIKSVMSYGMAFGFLLILSTVSAFSASLFFWILMWGIMAFWRMLRNRIAS